MNTVFLVSKAGELDTRLILTDDVWLVSMREKLSEMGYSVQATDQDPNLVVRDELEWQRWEHLFEICAPL